MASDKPLTAFEREFMARTKFARESIDFSQEEMAQALGINQGRYKHYEGRNPLPHEFIGPFCAITRRSETWLFSGKNPKVVPKVVDGERRRPARNGSRSEN